MAAAQKSDSNLQLYLGPIVGILVLLFAVSKAYERAELVSYDWRFNIRNSIFGPPVMDPRLGTIEIDDQTLQVEGRWQDWTRTEYVDVVRILGEYQAEMVGFDIYFIEPKTKLVSEKQLRGLNKIDQASIDALLVGADYDLRFREAIDQADNVYLAQFLIKQALDVGAYGLVLPHIESKEEALSAVRAARYFQKSGTSDFDPPGLRGVSPAVAARYWGLSIDEYMEKADLWPLDPSGEVLLIMLIESREGAENIDAILEAPGIGGIFIGTWDLATSLGFPRDSEAPQVAEAIAKILAASKKAGIPCGITTTIDTVDRHLNQGFRILTVGSDVGVSPAAAVVLEHLGKAEGGTR